MGNSTTFLCPSNTGCRNHCFGYTKYYNPVGRRDKQKEHFGSHQPLIYLCGASFEVSKEIRRWPASWSLPSSYILWNSRYFPVETKTKQYNNKSCIPDWQTTTEIFSGAWQYIFGSVNDRTLYFNSLEAQFIAVSRPYQETWADRWEALRIQDCQLNQGLRSRRFCNILIKTYWVRKKNI